MSLPFISRIEFQKTSSFNYPKHFLEIKMLHVLGRLGWSSKPPLRGDAPGPGLDAHLQRKTTVTDVQNESQASANVCSDQCPLVSSLMLEHEQTHRIVFLTR